MRSVARAAGVTLAVLFFLTTMQSVAAERQNALPRRLPPAERLMHMRRGLHLSPAQEARIKPILDRHDAGVRKIDADPEGEKQARKRKLRQATDASIMSVLLPEQRARFERSRQIREKMGIGTE